jgi:hypothetical protein
MIQGDEKRWPDYIDAIEIAHNSTVASATGYTPFFVNHGFDMPLAATVLAACPTSIPAPDEYAAHMAAIHESARDAILLSQAGLRVSAARHRRPADISVGDSVMIDKRSYNPESTPERNAAKLRPLRNGPFLVIRRLEHDNYEVELPADYKGHRIFHASKLTKVVANPAQFKSRQGMVPPSFPKPPQPIRRDGTKYYHVNKILGHRYNKDTKTTEFLFSFVGYPEEDNTWLKLIVSLATTLFSLNILPLTIFLNVLLLSVVSNFTFFPFFFFILLFLFFFSSFSTLILLFFFYKIEDDFYLRKEEKDYEVYSLFVVRSFLFFRIFIVNILIMFVLSLYYILYHILYIIL